MPRRRREARGTIILPLKFDLDILFQIKKDEPPEDLAEAIGKAWAKAFGEMMDRWSDRLFAEGKRGNIRWPPLQPSTLMIRRLRGFDHTNPMIETGRLFNALKNAIQNIQVGEAQTQIRFPRRLRSGLGEGTIVAGIVYEGSATLRYPPIQSKRSGRKKGRRSSSFFYPIAHFFPTYAPVFGRGSAKYKPPRPFLPQSNDDLLESDIDVLAKGIRNHVEQVALEVSVNIAVRHFRKIRKVEVGEIQFRV